MNSIARSLGSAAVLAASGGAAFYFGLFESKLVTLCESEITDRLRAPSTYRRIEVKTFNEPQSAEAYRTWRQREIHSASSPRRREIEKLRLESDLNEIQAGTKSPVLYTLYFSYDAANGFGAPIRGTSKCEYLAPDGDDAGASTHDVYVDGFNHTDWMIELMRRAS